MVWCPKPYSPSSWCAVAFSAGTSSSTSDPGDPGNLRSIHIIIIHIRKYTSDFALTKRPHQTPGIQGA
eukprot:1003627-Pelagomonas_calceolata.AAC.3